MIFSPKNGCFFSVKQRLSRNRYDAQTSHVRHISSRNNINRKLFYAALKLQSSVW